LGLGLAAGPASAPVARAAPAIAPHAETYTFAFHDADIAQVAEAILGNALGLSYTIDPAITGKISFRIDQRLTGAQLLESFEAALEGSDVAIVRQGGSLSLIPRAKAKGSAPMRSLGDTLHGAGYETVAVPLEYATPSEVAKALQAVTTQDPVVYMDDKQGLLILGGTANELDSAVKVVRLLDKSGLEDTKIRFIDLDEAPAQTVAADLDKILDASHVEGVTVVPLKRLNGLFVFARTMASLDEVARWVAKLDVDSRDKSTSLFVYHPRNLSAQSLGSTLGGGGADSGQMAGAGSVGGSNLGTPSASPTTGSSGRSGARGQLGGASPRSSDEGSGGLGEALNFLSTQDDPVRMAVDRDTNTLLFSASPSRWIKIQRTLDELDTPPSQVLIEASILEVTLTDQMNMGVDWKVLSDSGKLSIGAVTNPSGVIGANTPGFAVTFLGKNIQTAFNALSGASAVEVVSSPKIVALDNHVAHLEVGDQIPVLTQSSQNTTSAGAPIINTVSYLDTGIILDVTPRISGDDRIFLDISQEVSSVAQTTTSGIDSPTVQQRSLATSLVLDNGGVAALGGLISSNHSKTDNGIPYISNIPGLGSLFKTDTRNGARTELIVLITATIIRDRATQQRVMANLLADMNDIKSHGLLAP
jgi:general secretion pathway protein D